MLKMESQSKKMIVTDLSIYKIAEKESASAVLVKCEVTPQGMD